MADEALQQAREADRELAAGNDRGPLHGVPISIKDLLDIRGLPTTAASRVREGHVAERDAPTIAHLRQAGAVFVGKTNLHEFAFGTTNEDSAFGPARNPHDPSRSPGGSSGGSAASVAAGMALATIGTDTGGSIRIPAAACGIVGLKPSLGEVSTDGVVPLSRTLDHVGPLAQTVTDACLVYHALMGDVAAKPPAPMPVHGLRLAVPRRYFCDLLDDEVRARFEEALERLRTAGAHVDDIDDPSRRRHRAGLPAHRHRRCRRVSRRHARGDAGAIHGAGPACGSRWDATCWPRTTCARSTDAKQIIREVDAALAQHDALILPTLPIPAPPIGASDGARRRGDRARAQPDAAAHAAVQRDRPPGDRAAVRQDRGRSALLRPARRHAHADRRVAARGPRLRASDHVRRTPGPFWTCVAESALQHRLSTVAALRQDRRLRRHRDVRRRHRFDIRRRAVDGIDRSGKSGFGRGGCSKVMLAQSCNYTSNPIARISASALLCSTTPGRMR